jgi:hypothetical protein
MTLRLGPVCPVELSMPSLPVPHRPDALLGPTVKPMNRPGSLDVTRWPRLGTVGVVVSHPIVAGVNA